VLESDGQLPTASVEVRNPFNPATFVTEKWTILDVKATDEQGAIFMVEFQTSERQAFADRMTYYGCRSFGGQMYQGTKYSSLQSVIAIAVTTFEMFRKLRRIHNSFRLTAKADSSVVFTDKLQMHILEAAEEKIDRVSELPPALGAWMNFYYYSHRISEGDMTALLQDQPIVQQAYGKYQQFNRDERMRAIDEAHQQFLNDLASDIEESHEKGWNKRNIEVARSMRNEGLGIDVIVKITGLSSVEIDRLG
jgi:predicted transposase/invertase (TIGR01784 family)